MSLSTSMNDDALLELVADTVRTYCLTTPSTPDSLSAETVLFGPSGLLDSMGLVSVVVELEQKLSDHAGREVSLMDDRALSQARSPFRTVGSLADYARARLSSEDSP